MDYRPDLLYDRSRFPARVLTLELLAERKIAKACILIVACALAAAAGARAAPGRVEVFYIGTDDCFYCQHWEAARKPELLAAMRGTTAKLIEIRGESISKPVSERHYPRQHRWLYARLGEIRGVPRFVLAIDGKVVLTAQGTSDYSRNFEPNVRAALAKGMNSR